jgi:hypothetical protein
MHRRRRSWRRLDKLASHHYFDTPFHAFSEVSRPSAAAFNGADQYRKYETMCDLGQFEAVKQGRRTVLIYETSETRAKAAHDTAMSLGARWYLSRHEFHFSSFSRISPIMFDSSPAQWEAGEGGRYPVEPRST